MVLWPSASRSPADVTAGPADFAAGRLEDTHAPATRLELLVIKYFNYDLFFMKVIHEAHSTTGNCRSFLSLVEEMDPEEGVIDGHNNQQHRAILINIKDLLNSELILELCDGMVLFV